MEELYLETAEKWRSWLAGNHDRSDGVWLVYCKKESGQPTIPYGASVEEALCYGWIDSIIRNLDEVRYARKFTPRKADSLWSDANKKRIEALIRDERMAAPGLAKVEAAKASGQWDKSAAPDFSADVPPELDAALAKNPAAKEFFDSLTPGYRKQFIGWIATAKRPETKQKRVEKSIALLGKGEKLGMV